MHAVATTLERRGEHRVVGRGRLPLLGDTECVAPPAEGLAAQHDSDCQRSRGARSRRHARTRCNGARQVASADMPGPKPKASDVHRVGQRRKGLAFALASPAGEHVAGLGRGPPCGAAVAAEHALALRE